MEEPHKKYPAFMKPFFADCSKTMQIHPAFTSFMKSLLPDKALLRKCIDSRLWTVHVAKIGDDFYFEEGWAKFVEENHITFGDLLVFHYNGDRVFDFKIIGKTASEKELLEAFDFNRQNEKEAAGYDEKQEPADEMMNKKTPKRKYEKASGESSSACKESGDISPGAKAGGSTEAENLEDESPCKTGYMNGNPYFVTKIRENSRGALYVPAEIINENCIKLHQDITLRDPCERAWRSKVFRLKDGCVRLQGWNLFCKCNNLHEGDECVCEIVGGRDGMGTATHIQVHISKLKSSFQKAECPREVGSAKKGIYQPVHLTAKEGLSRPVH